MKVRTPDGVAYYLDTDDLDAVVGKVYDGQSKHSEEPASLRWTGKEWEVVDAPSR